MVRENSGWGGNARDDYETDDLRYRDPQAGVGRGRGRGRQADYYEGFWPGDSEYGMYPYYPRGWMGDYPGGGYGAGRYGQGYEGDYAGRPSPMRPDPRRYGAYSGRSQRGGRDFWDRAGDEIASWFGDEDAERRRQRDEHRGRGPKGYVRSDARIEEDVNDRLTDDGMLDASDIDVQVADREVTLTGTVTSRMAKRRAEDIVDSVSGVEHVQNNLRVIKPSSVALGESISSS
ncbi:MAG: BON domain-containing protein [Rhizobiaceae bacterium]|jgi:osmotically-inducible protein OsmY